MITINKNTSDRINHFRELCDFVTPAEQAELRALGNSYFEQVSGIITYLNEYVKRNPCLDEMLGPLARELDRALETCGYVLDGRYYNDEQPTAERSMEERNLAGDGMYFRMMNALKECKDKNVETELLIFISGHNENEKLKKSDEDNNDSSDK